MFFLHGTKPQIHTRRILNQIALFVLVCTLQSVIYAQQTLVLSAVGQPPLNTESHDGFMDEVTREAINRIGYQLEITMLPAERSLRSSNEGLIDGEMSRVEGMEKLYPNLVRVPEKIMDWEFCVFSKKPITIKDGWSSLSDKNVAFITGWKILEKNVPRAAVITKTRNAVQLFTLLKVNRADYVIYERWGGHRILKTLQINDVKSRRPFLASKEMYIYLHKKNQALVPRLSQAIASMKKDGSYERLVKKHLPLQKSSH